MEQGTRVRGQGDKMGAKDKEGREGEKVEQRAEKGRKERKNTKGRRGKKGRKGDALNVSFRVELGGCIFQRLI